MFGIKDYFSCLQRFVFLPVILLVLLGCAQDHSLMVINQTDSNIEMLGADINGKPIMTRTKITLPRSGQYSPPSVYANFVGRDRDLLTIDLQGPSGLRHKASCELKVVGQKTCLIKAFYSGDVSLKCACDPYSDFDE